MQYLSLKMAENFSVKWNDFQSNISTAFKLLRKESHLHDVTLVSDDLSHFTAHKVVLSACSEYFKKIFHQTSHTHQTLLCLEGTSAGDLQNILDYVYEGEVQIQQSDLDRFLAIAGRLKLNGLLAGEGVKQESQGQDEINYRPKIIQRTNHRDTKSTSSKWINNRNVPTEKVVNVNAYSDVNEMFKDNIISNTDGSFSCKICGKLSSKTNAFGNMKSHLQVHVGGQNLSCKICLESFKSKEALKLHMCTHLKPMLNI